MVGKVWCVSGPSCSSGQVRLLIHIAPGQEVLKGQEAGPGYKLKAHPLSRDILPPPKPQSPVLRAGLRPWGLSKVPSRHAVVHKVFSSQHCINHKVKVSPPAGSQPVLQSVAHSDEDQGWLEAPKNLGKGHFRVNSAQEASPAGLGRLFPCNSTFLLLTCA